MSLWLIIPFVYILSLQKFRRNILDFFRTVSIHNLSFPVRATEMRIYPKRAIDDVCMRLEIYGCLGKRSGCSFSDLKEIGQGSHSLFEVVFFLRVLSLSLFSRITWKSIATDCSAQRDKGNSEYTTKSNESSNTDLKNSTYVYLSNLLFTFKI